MSPVRAVARRWSSVTAELLLGAVCPGCEEPGAGLCPACRDRLSGTRPCPTAPEPSPAGFPPTVTAGPYDNLLRHLISAHKERQAWLLTGALATQLSRSVETLLATRPIDPAVPVLLVPIPSARQAIRTRGRDAIDAISRSAAARLRPRLQRPVRTAQLLQPVRRLADQSQLTAAQRRANLAGAYAVRRRRLPPGPVALILVDDLVTTGSSLTEGTRALAATGTPAAGAAVIAATRRRGPASARGNS